MHSLCVRLHGAFQDTHSLYLLQEFVPGERQCFESSKMLDRYHGAQCLLPKLGSEALLQKLHALLQGGSCWRG